jgi:uncharacterized protein YggE
MKTKTVLISVCVLLAVLLSACTSTTAQPPVRSMSVTGIGEVALKPDIAYITIGVHTEKNTATEAMAQNNTDTQAVVNALKAGKVADADLQTNNFNIYANNRVDPQGQPIGTTYSVDNTVYVKVRDLAKLGDLLDAAVKAGANNINSIQFDVVDKTKATTDARAAAVKAAKAQADELAAAAGVSLGSIQSISYYDSVPGPFYENKGMGGATDMAAVAAPINPGTLKVSVNVTLTYEIK